MKARPGGVKPITPAKSMVQQPPSGGGMLTGFGQMPGLPRFTPPMPTQGGGQGGMNWQHQNPFQQNPLLGTQLAPQPGAQQPMQNMQNAMPPQNSGGLPSLQQALTNSVMQSGSMPTAHGVGAQLPQSPQFGGAPQFPNTQMPTNVPPMAMNPAANQGQRMPGANGPNDFYTKPRLF